MRRRSNAHCTTLRKTLASGFSPRYEAAFAKDATFDAGSGMKFRYQPVERFKRELDQSWH
jgi:hypothetical protein